MDDSLILVVEDDARLRERLARYLASEGFRVTASGDAADARAKLRAINPDLMVLDVMMEQPDDGIAMAQELRRTGQMLPIVMLTSVGKVTGMSFDKDSDLVPVDAFFEKPVRPDELIGTVRDLLARKK